MVLKEQILFENLDYIIQNIFFKFFFSFILFLIEDYKELDFLKKYTPPPKDIKTGSQAAKIGANKPFTPNELNKNDIT